MFNENWPSTSPSRASRKTSPPLSATCIQFIFLHLLIAPSNLLVFAHFFLSFTLFLMLLFGCNIDRKLILMKDMLTGSALDAILNVRVFSIKDGVRAKSNHSNTFAQVKCYGTTWKQKFIFILSKWWEKMVQLIFVIVLSTKQKMINSRNATT